MNKLFKISPEIESQLKTFEQLVLKWQKTINLIAPSTVSDIWNRHILDSVQVADLIPQQSVQIIDIGSGGGFPGVILSILGYSITLVERDQRKAIFLQEAFRTLKTDGKVFSDDFKNFPTNVSRETPLVFTARAFASLSDILAITEPFFKFNPTFILMKGERYQEEIQEALKNYSFEYTTTQSKTNGIAVILTLTKVQKND